ncbi:hypothetical protein [Acidithiobacillus acidisediminis]|nr:hypothetical protein [Acidithiobacillus sp. S30A2]
MDVGTVTGVTEVEEAISARKFEEVVAFLRVLRRRNDLLGLRQSNVG